jgi:hypothetical protein
MIKKIELIKIFDIPIKLDLSWFIILAFITWTLAQNQTHTQHFSVELDCLIQIPSKDSRMIDTLCLDWHGYPPFVFLDLTEKT